MFMLHMEKPININSFSTKLAHTYMILKLYFVCHEEKVLYVILLNRNLEMQNIFIDNNNV
jgi:hypothetical protein